MASGKQVVNNIESYNCLDFFSKNKQNNEKCLRRAKMKKTYLIALISLMLITGLVFIGCGGMRSPTSVVRQIHTAVEKGDNKAISELLTPEAAGIVLKMLPDFQRAYAESGGIAKMEQNITGNTAVVTVTYRNGDTDDYDLVRVDGRWKGTIIK